MRPWREGTTRKTHTRTVSDRSRHEGPQTPVVHAFTAPRCAAFKLALMRPAINAATNAPQVKKKPHHQDVGISLKALAVRVRPASQAVVHQQAVGKNIDRTRLPRRAPAAPHQLLRRLPAAGAACRNVAGGSAGSVKVMRAQANLERAVTVPRRPTGSSRQSRKQRNPRCPHCRRPHPCPHSRRSSAPAPAAC